MGDGRLTLRVFVWREMGQWVATGIEHAVEGLGASPSGAAEELSAELAFRADWASVEPAPADVVARFVKLGSSREWVKWLPHGLRGVFRIDSSGKGPAWQPASV